LLVGRAHASSVTQAGLIRVKVTVCDIVSSQKEALLAELVGALVGVGVIPPDESSSVVQALTERERLASTGIGAGVAVPHAKHPAIRGVVGVVGRSSRGVDFDALDGEPVDIVFLLLASPEAASAQLRALQQTARLLHDGKLCRRLHRARNCREMVELVTVAESSFGVLGPIPESSSSQRGSVLDASVSRRAHPQ